MRHAWLATLLLIPASAGPARAQDALRVTLAEAIALAARHDPAVVQAQGSVRSTGAAVRSAKGAYLPSVSGSAGGGSSFSDGPSRLDPITGEVLPGGVSSKSVGFGLLGDIELFAGFRRGADVRAARGRQTAAVAGLTSALAQSALQVSTEFFSALATRELVAVRQESVRRAEEQLAVAIAKLVTRASNVADSLRAVVQLGEARLALVGEQARLAGAEAALARRLGMGGRVAAVSDPSLEAPGAPVDRTAILTEALARAPSVAAAEANVLAAEAGVTAAQSSYWPRLALSGSWSFNGSDRNDYELFNDRSVRLGISWPLFNRFQREEQVVQRKVSLDTERARLADARREVESRLAAQFAALDAARERIELTRLSVEAARADVTIALERYRLGSIGIVDLNSAQSGLTRAEESAVSARFEYLRARAEIEAILGRPL